ncbi:MAG: HAD family hydrolase [Mycobacteriales bacterium]
MTLSGLLVDYGGVLTNPLADTMAAWCELDGVEISEFRRVMRELLGPGFSGEAAANPVHALERGELAIPDFERQLASRLRTTSGGRVAAEGLLRRMFAAFRTDASMVAAVRRAHAAGIRTGLVSNSWGLDYPREGWAELFDAVVISGEVGMRKPEPAIYLYAAERIGLAPEQCVFVDDLVANVKGASAVGMQTVLHRDPEATLAALETYLGVRISSTGHPDVAR